MLFFEIYTLFFIFLCVYSFLGRRHRVGTIQGYHTNHQLPPWTASANGTCQRCGTARVPLTGPSLPLSHFLFPSDADRGGTPQCVHSSAVGRATRRSPPRPPAARSAGRCLLPQFLCPLQTRGRLSLSRRLRSSRAQAERDSSTRSGHRRHAGRPARAP